MSEFADWVIYYADGSSYSSLDGPPEDAPRMYVQCIAIADISCGHYTLAEFNFYCWHGDEWIPHDTGGLLQYLAAPGKEKIVLQGYWINRKVFNRMRKDARSDPRLPPKTANDPRLPSGETE